MCTTLKGNQRKYLRGLAHPLKPVVLIGSRGLTPALVDALEQALRAHELVKVKFNDNKDKVYKQSTIAALEKAVTASMVGLIGHTAIFYRPHPDPEKRIIKVPGGG